MIVTLTRDELNLGARGSETEGASAPGQKLNEGPSRPLFRPVQYLGSKLRVIEAICGLAQELAPRGSSVVDLFTGSTVVAQGFAQTGFKTTAVDTQAYAATFGQALLGVGRRFGDALDSSAIISSALACDQQSAVNWLGWRQREDDHVAAGDGAALRELDRQLPLAWRTGLLVADPATPLTSFYAGSYFGVRQGLDLDLIARAITQSSAAPAGSWRRAAFLTALMHAASLVVHSAGKHFAQPLKGRAANARFLDARLLADRRLQVLNLFVEACAAIERAAPQSNEGHCSVKEEAEVYIAQASRHALYYLDPPYTAQQYSRFYHVLETIATGSLPALAEGAALTSGLYPPNRYKSAFSSRRKAPAALERTIGHIADQGAGAIVSYSVSASGSDGNARMISFQELLDTCHHAFSPNRVGVVDLQHRYRQFNSGDNAKASRNDREVLLVCRPA